MKLTLSSIPTKNNFNIYILILTHTSSNIIPQTLNFSKKASSELNRLLIKHLSVYHLNSFVLLLAKLAHMVTPVKNSPLKLLTTFTVILARLYSSLFSFMIVFNAKQTNIFLFISNNISLPLPFFENATHFNYRMSMHSNP